MARKKTDPRATKAQKQERINLIIEAICRGYNYSKITNMYSEKWELSKKHVQKYIRLAQDEVLEQHRKEQERILEKHGKKIRYTLAKQLLKLDRIYVEAFKGGHWGTCVKCIREQNELYGLYELKPNEIADTNITINYDTVKNESDN